MKTLFGRNKHVVLTVAVVFGVAIVTYAQEQKTGKSSAKVEITSDMIVLPPTVHLLQADEQALDNALAKYDKALYKIQTVKNGNVVKTQGKLKDTKMTGAMKAEMAQPLAGKSDKIHHTICPNPCDITKTAIKVKARAPSADAKKLIEELKPILEKYQ